MFGRLEGTMAHKNGHLWTCCQFGCQIAFVESNLTYETGGEGS
jgi:hypothetical protein